MPSRFTRSARSPGHVEICCELCALIRFETPRRTAGPSLAKGPGKCFETLRGKACAGTYLDYLQRGQQQARAQRPDRGGRVTRPRPCMCPVVVLALLYVEFAEIGPLPSGIPKNPSRIRISPVKQKGRFPALFALCTFAPTFREVSGGSGVQPAWVLGLR